MLEKRKTWRNKAYLRWITEEHQKCVICGHQGWDDNQLIAHHAIGMGLGGMTGGKASDSLAMPMHVRCHNRFHQTPHEFKEEQWRWLITTLDQAIQWFAEQKR